MSSLSWEKVWQFRFHLENNLWYTPYGYPQYKSLNFQYKLLNNVLYLNQKSYQFRIVSCSPSVIVMMKHHCFYFMNVFLHEIYGSYLDYILQKKWIHQYKHHRVPSLVLLTFKIKIVSCLIIYFSYSSIIYTTQESVII